MILVFFQVLLIANSSLLWCRNLVLDENPGTLNLHQVDLLVMEKDLCKIELLLVPLDE
jgi:hypothetical protein